MNKSVRHIFFLFLVLSLYTCANQGFPPGGPVDDIPPNIVTSMPEPNSLQVSRMTSVEFEFSEKIDSRTVQNAVFVSPNPGENLEISSKGKKITITFNDSLIVDVTYTITLGTDIKDLRGNNVKQSYTLAFSTGDQLDEKQIQGQVYYEKPEDVSVWAYMVYSDSVIDPTNQQAQYITQCGADGRFRFSNLAPRRYRLFAVTDRNRNRLYQINQEFIGLTFSDIDLSGDEMVVQNRYFKLTKRDTSRVRILQIEQEDQYHLRIRFSRSVMLSEYENNQVTIYNANGDSCTLYDLSMNPKDHSIWSVTTMPRDSGDYTIVFHTLMDEYKEILTELPEIDFVSIARPDTSHPNLVEVVPEDSTQSMMPTSSFFFQFSESIDTTGSDQFFTLYEDSIECKAYTVEWSNLTELKINPKSTWSGNTWYICELSPNKIKDFAGNIMRESKTTYAWKVVNPDTLSSISGRISDEHFSASGSIILELNTPGMKEASYTTVLSDTGFFSFPDILPGSYIVHGYRDADENDIYSPGTVFPYRPAERFFVGQDTILVRSRWPNEGNDYRFRK